MSLNALEIYLTKSRKIIVQSNGKQSSSLAAVATFNRNLISLGFVCSQELTGALAGLSDKKLGSLYQQVRTVLDKIDIAGDTTVNIPLFLDLQENQVVWADIALKSRGPINNSRQAGESLVLMGKAVTGLIKPTLYDLFDMHAEARGSRVDSPASADTVFGLHDGTITPFDADRIMSEFMTNGTDQSDVQGNVMYVTT